MKDIISIDNIKSITVDDIYLMDEGTQIAYLRYWINNYKNTIPERNKKELRSEALRCVKYIEKYKKNDIENCCIKLYNKIIANDKTDYVTNVFVQPIQYSAAMYWLYKKRYNDFIEALFSTQPNRYMTELLYKYFYDNTRDYDNIDNVVKRRTKDGLEYLLEPVYKKEINTEYDIVIKEKILDNKRSVLVFELPSKYADEERKLNIEEVIEVDNYIYYEWNEIMPKYKRIISRHNNSIDISQYSKYVFEYDINWEKSKNNTRVYVMFAKFITWENFGEIFIAK